MEATLVVADVQKFFPRDMAGDKKAVMTPYRFLKTARHAVHSVQVTPQIDFLEKRIVHRLKKTDSPQ